MTENQNEAVEAALGLALSDWNKNWEGYQQAQIKFRPFQDEDESSIKTAATILATEVRRLREENRELAERNQWQRDELRRCRDELESLDDFRDR